MSSPDFIFDARPSTPRTRRSLKIASRRMVLQESYGPKENRSTFRCVKWVRMINLNCGSYGSLPGRFCRVPLIPPQRCDAAGIRGKPIIVYSGVSQILESPILDPSKTRVADISYQAFDHRQVNGNRHQVKHEHERDRYSKRVLTDGTCQVTTQNAD
jgi:hypothetical protein